ncbi:MAG: 3'(2'),5'-bisphosphate nucleotidase [Bacteroidetes bacterium]|nr:MAG: 3'(2'),5'-bisphosphate nucleotidase [Bacteroidota bacterium]
MLLHIAIQAAIASGKAVLDLYQKHDIHIAYKADESPVTEADMAANEIIKKHLLPSQLPIVSEETTAPPYAVRQSWEKYWMIDPIDGTKEFINKTDDFTINIALVEQNYPVIGVIYLPVFDVLYFSLQNKGAYKLERASVYSREADVFSYSQSLPLQKTENYTVLISRSHPDTATDRLIQDLKSIYDNLTLLARGSSLKFCLLAEGLADIYPRLMPLNEWDVAAGIAIADASGAKIYHPDTKAPLTFNTPNLMAAPFIVERG